MNNISGLSDSPTYLINCIYTSTEGEGIFIGTPQIFVRFQGCLIGCVNCDSKETWDFNLFPPRSLTDVLAEIEGFSAKNAPHLIKRVSITGGDPLHPRHEESVYQLVLALKEKNYFINLEASGSRVVERIFKLVDYISFDFKTPSTKVKTPHRNLKQLIEHYPGKFQIKAVVTDQTDFDHVYATYKELLTSDRDQSLSFSFPWCLTPAYTPGEEFSPQKFAAILKMNEEKGGPFRVIGQQHKWVYGPNEKRV